MRSIYLACPYSIGDQAQNVRNSIDMADELINLGFVVFNPLLSHFQQIVSPRSYEYWMEIDLYWVEKCDCVFRMPGESHGADMEAAYATAIGKPVFYDIENLLNARFQHNRQ